MAFDENEKTKLQKLKEKAEKEGWSHCIKTRADEYALLQGYWFSWDRANAVIDYIENFLVLPKSGGAEPFKLLDWQKKEIFQPLFGWVRPNGTRRYRRGYIEMPKKNGKTATCSAIATYMLDGDGEPGAEVYNCANDRKQAKIVFKMIQDIVEHSKFLKHLTVTESTSIITKDSQSWIESWSSDAGNKDGPNIYLGLCDELHEWKGQAMKLWDVIKFGGAVRREPLCPLAITTAGTADEESVCLRQHKYALQILQNVIYRDLSFFALIYRADPEKIKSDPDYWKTEEAWKEANPSYGTILSKDSFKDAIEEAERDPVAKRTFLRYRLGVWTEAKGAWIPKDVWDACSKPELIDLQKLKGEKCWAAFDLSSTEDTTALTLCFPYQDDSGKWKFKFHSRIYCPEAQIEARSLSQNVRYDIWAQQKELIATPGPVVDHKAVYADFENFTKDYDVQMLTYDRRFSDWIIQKIIESFPGLELDPFGQGTASMSSPTKAFYRALKNELIEHEGTEILGWQASNAIAEENSGGEIKLNKAMSKDKIDVIISMIMSFGRANLYAEDNTFEFFYESEQFKKEIKKEDEKNN